MQRNSAQKGFTLIELVFVIVILGILAAFAVPRFVDLTEEARISSIEGLKGGIRSAAALTHAQWLAQGQPTSISVEGTTINMNSTAVNGYPEATDTNGIGDALQDTTGFDVTTGTDTITFGVENISNCNVEYSLPGDSDLPPTVSMDSSGC